MCDHRGGRDPHAGENWAMALLPYQGVTTVRGTRRCQPIGNPDFRTSRPTLLEAYLHADPGDDGGDVGLPAECSVNIG